jgi:sugar O-acyltransferase (sialic acid O-acetyltransferase NeuD family)
MTQPPGADARWVGAEPVTQPPGADPPSVTRWAAARPLVLLGAGGLARETAEAAGSGDGQLWRLVGYLDDAPALAGTQVAGLPVLGPTSAAGTLPGDPGFVATVASHADPLRRRRLVERLGLADRRWATVVHPFAQLGRSTRIGPGCVVLATCVATADVQLGRHVVMMPGCILTHDDVVADYATLASGVTLSGGVRVGTDAYLGAGATVREGVRIGVGAVVGMGAVVTRDVPDGQVWAGVPARYLRPAG